MLYAQIDILQCVPIGMSGSNILGKATLEGRQKVFAIFKNIENIYSLNACKNILVVVQVMDLSLCVTVLCTF